MSEGRVVSSADDIDLTRHGVIEAHAGTGKTYTIVGLVLRMLEQTTDRDKGDGRYVHIRNVLLVTFTEKAAGELKKRIRDGLAARINEIRGSGGDGGLAAHLETCLNNMHEAFIGTIHAVCLRLLQTWPFETGAHFNTAQVEDDNEGAEAALRASMRTDWEDAGSGLPQGLRAMERHGVKLEQKHAELITETALKVMANDGAAPDATPAGYLTLEDAISKADSAGEAELDASRQKLLYAFIIRAAEILSSKYGAYKQEKGLVSYDDMLRLTRNAVYSENGEMVKRLRVRLRYGIIDEFQDTSPVQWSIFQKIFLGGGNAKMYIVGDPKQSIYSFQGADINSYVSAKAAIAESGGALYRLVNNYRSLPEMISGYNAILCGAEDWFLFGGDGGISYPARGAACPPPRGAAPRPLAHKPVQAVRLDADSEPENRCTMAEAACAAIKKLVGTTISIPKGPRWEDLTLDYGDFAVIIEAHYMTAPFAEAFRKRGIPYAKYKMTGIFQSVMARDLIALLSAISRRHSRPRRAAALLTHFFNRAPESIAPDADTDYCQNPRCAGDSLCAAHALDAWGKLADGQLWAQLFKNIFEKTGIRRKLIRLADGERMLADLRQVTDYCVERLYGQNSNLDNLAQHLKRLYDSEDGAGGDKNLHTLATEKSSVKILTMHAAKGLEFPVVFLMDRNLFNPVKDAPNGPTTLPWADASNKRQFTPYISKDDLREGRGKNRKDLVPLERYKEGLARERRRLLYVAMTRPQAMLFAPMREPDKEEKADNDLTPRLKELIRRRDPNVEIFNGAAWDKDIGTANGASANETAPTLLDDIPALSLQKFICVETSYSQISDELKRTPHLNTYHSISPTDNRVGDGYPNPTSGEAGDIDTAVSDDSDALLNDEYHAEDADTATVITAANPLPGGRATGDALHKAIEEMMRSDDIGAIINDDAALCKLAEQCLRRGGILDLPSTPDPTAAVKQAAYCIKTALTLPYPAPDGKGFIDLSALPKTDRVPEMEFLLSLDPRTDDFAAATMPPNAAPYRIRGFIDLVFRLKNENCSTHPYRYHIIDWKSDTLENYEPEALRRYCADQHYLLQSQIYARALERHLSGILGSRYDRAQHLGGSLYVFLRGGTGIFL
jgi:exodeoxyribonuclease V beta subunit